MHKQLFPLSALTIALCSAMPSFAATSLQEVEVSATENTTVETAPAETEEKTHSSKGVERIEVTGSRLQHGNITAKQLVIDQEEIKARGVTSVEELIRTLPQNLATIGSITNERGKSPLGEDERGRQAAVSSMGSLGVSAANFGGVGAGQTLVLINGRRIAGAAGIEDGFVNLNGIPLSAIERVEISMDGASAIYGADAMGGVINFILKRNFSGSTLSLQHEYSANDADNTRISLYTGLTWDSGNASITLEHSIRNPVNNWKSGFTTLDYSDYFGSDAYDHRSLTYGAQPGMITWYDYDPETYLSYQTGITLPSDFTGRPSMDDFVPIDTSNKVDYVPELAGPDTKSTSVTLHIEQDIIGGLSFFADGLYTRSTNSREVDYYSTMSLELAPGQYYNPFPANYFYNQNYRIGTSVTYVPLAEINQGILPSGKVKNTRSTWNFSTGLSYEFNNNTKLDFVYSTSGDSSHGDQMNLGNLVSFIADDTAENGVQCYNYGFNTGVYDDDLEYFQAAFDRQCEILTSTDPDQAFNPWSSEGAGELIKEFYIRSQTDNRSTRMDNYELRLNGAAWTLPAGTIYYAVGAEAHEDGVSSKEVRNFTGTQVSRDRYAFFGEMTIPVLGKDFSFTGAKSLTLSLAARRDIYKTEGAVGTVDNIPYDQGGELIFDENTFAKTTPSFGVYWEPVDNVGLRAKWSRGFQAPVFTALFSTLGTQVYTTSIYDDPYYDCSEHGDCTYEYGTYKAYAADSVNAPNPDLKPQTSIQRSLSLSWFPTGMLRGLNVDVSYNRLDRWNEYGNLDDLVALTSTAERLALEKFYPRDENGKITAQRNMQFNLAGSKFESISYDVRYLINTSVGSFEPRIQYLDNLKQSQQAFADSELVSRVGYIQGVDDYKITGSMRWGYQDVTATLWAYYFPDYINDYETYNAGGNKLGTEYERRVGSYLSFDLTATYQMTDDFRVNFAGRNILDNDPVFTVVGDRPYDTARYNAAGRTFSLELQYEF